MIVVEGMAEEACEYVSHLAEVSKSYLQKIIFNHLGCLETYPIF